MMPCMTTHRGQTKRYYLVGQTVALTPEVALPLPMENKEISPIINLRYPELPILRFRFATASHVVLAFLGYRGLLNSSGLLIRSKSSLHVLRYDKQFTLI